MSDETHAPPPLIDHSTLTPAQHTVMMAEVVRARRVLAAWDPVGEPMEVLALAGCYACRVSGTTPSGMRFGAEGGAPRPKRSKR